MCMRIDDWRIRAPEGMSYINAFWAIYGSASRDTQGMTAQRIAAIFHERITIVTQYGGNLYFNDLDGRPIGIDFTDFPILTTATHDSSPDIVKFHGTAESLLNAYNQVPPSERLDKNDRISFAPIREKMKSICVVA